MKLSGLDFVSTVGTNVALSRGMSESNQHNVEILEIEAVTHDVRRFVTSKPEGFEFKPGQATEVAMAKDGWREEKRPFTFTSLPTDPNLEFTIKIYPERDGVTDRLGELEVGDELIIGEAWGAIQYQGPGTFIAGGAGVTPFIAIFRELEKTEKLEGNRLIFSNHSEDDVILAGELRRLFGDRALYTLTEGSSDHYETSRIDRDFLKNEISDFEQNFYVCGPPEMVEDVVADLRDLGVSEDHIVREEAA